METYESKSPESDPFETENWTLEKIYFHREEKVK